MQAGGYQSCQEVLALDWRIMGRFLLMHFPYVQNVFYHHNYTIQAWRSTSLPLKILSDRFIGRCALIEEPLSDIRTRYAANPMQRWILTSKVHAGSSL
jgi:hypothetical protein